MSNDNDKLDNFNVCHESCPKGIHNISNNIYIENNINTFDDKKYNNKFFIY